MARRWLLWALLIGFAWVMVGRFTEVEKLVQTLSRGQWQWVLAAALLQVIYYVVFAAVYQTAFAAVDVRSRIRDVLPVLFASLFTNVVAPGSGTALFVDDAVQRGQSGIRAAAGTVLVRIADSVAFMLVLAVGMAYLFLRHDLRIYEVVGAIILVAATGGLTGVLLLGLWQPSRLRRLLEWVRRAANRVGGWFRRPSWLAEDWPERNTAEFTSAALEIAAHPRRLNRPLLIALIAHAIDLTSLYVLFLAFHQPVSIGILVAGFAMGVLFWMVAITPQGIGVVEGVMALTYISLGVPPARATVIALAFRGLTLWLPVVIGFLLLQRVKTFGAEERLRAEVWSVRAAAILTAFMGVVNVVSAVTPALHGRLAILARFSPLEVRHGSDLAAALAGFALILLARQLWRRKHVAWLLAILALVISAVSHLLKGLDYEEASVAALLAAGLLFLRPHFHARSDLPSVAQGLGALGAALLFTVSYGAIGFYLLDRQFSVNFSLGAALGQTVTMFTQFYDPGLHPVTRFAEYFAGSVYSVCAVTLAYAALMLFRPVLVRMPATSAERERARAIIEAYGRSSLARCNLFDDKSYFLSAGGSVVSYAVKGHIALALGDPIGPAEDVPAAVSEFGAHCARNDWHAAHYQVFPDYLGHYRAAGFSALCVGHEAIVDLHAFSLAGGGAKSVRQSVNRVAKLGYHAKLHDPPLPDDLMRELRAISDEWLTRMHGTEKRFSLGWFDDDYIRNSPVMVVLDPDGFPTAFANVMTEYQLDEVTVDLMRRRTDAEAGIMDLLFVSLFEWAKAEGYATFNLGLSPLSGVGLHVSDPLVERALHYIYEHVDQFYSFKGLHAFKEKFRPRWSPRYLVYPGMPSLPSVAIALIRADSGDDFVWDHLRDFLGRRLPGRTPPR